MIEVDFAQARASLGTLIDAVANGGERVLIRRGNGEDVALVPAAELRSLQETAHLLRSPKNTARLLRVILRAREGRSPAEG
ncbi:MAG TPA: type II toxin-antitoxin system prevent-host-death family antitoxin [Longimicrobiaceae bacterium]|nr:type II toxin-antitoxin system prevent-host-death family antitoxin [Longimicrobiaceae bacterium]